MAKIEIITRPVDFPGLTLLPDPTTPQHSFLLYTDDFGQKQILRGGQFSDFDKSKGHKNQLNHDNLSNGGLLIVKDDYIKNVSFESIDWDDNYQSFPTSNMISGSDVVISQIWKHMSNAGQDINNAGLDFFELDFYIG
tara:strand:+ start:730 stop:1143 length:414 start_codon:yes stop_codon:yes gene_type:complete